MDSASSDMLNGKLPGPSSSNVKNEANDASDGCTTGAAYMYVRSGETWSAQAYLKASNSGASDWFGLSVSISVRFELGEFRRSWWTYRDYERREFQ